jgi:FtsZ-binding cell division protein ZapB
MTTIELHKNMKQAKLDADRDDLIQALDHLVQEAQTFKAQIQAGQVYNANLTHRGRVADELAESMRNTIDTIALLDAIQNDEA